MSVTLEQNTYNELLHNIDTILRAILVCNDESVIMDMISQCNQYLYMCKHQKHQMLTVVLSRIFTEPASMRPSIYLFLITLITHTLQSLHMQRLYINHVENDIHALQRVQRFLQEEVIV
jgi:hypothetical protein